MNASYYAIIPANVRYDKSLKPNAKLLYAEITALCEKEGFCWAENSYFAELYDVRSETISRWISQLHELGYIHVDIDKSVGNSRKIYLESMSTPIDKKVNTYCAKDQDLLTKKSRPIDKKVKSLVNTTINTKIKRETRAIDFFSEQYPTQWEAFLISYKSKIKDFQKFTADFNDTFDQEKLEYDDRVIRGRLNKYARNWVERQDLNLRRSGNDEPKPHFKRLG